MASSGASAGAAASAAAGASTGGEPAGCSDVVLPAEAVGGCAIRLVTPARCEEIDLTGGQTYEFAWTTDTTECETPYELDLAGNPLSDENVVSWSLSENPDEGITRTGGGVYRVGAQDLAPLSTDSGIYHWVVLGYYGSHPDSQTFRVRR
jgi:hypothetical protein